ncbi:O-antigen ligase family protein [Paenibacillus sp. GCM10012307]|uniref:O-antigen ligase family protein n=1 Tax=Paenibacillus roseus TaxID=2798579 RepID=A0A934J5U1_9BACL|nr:O-antigen ligase family protein [Paenibacillus roseus]MBJ6361326.1 O-antigen ligase family protein [Paenibacillus roseus]
MLFIYRMLIFTALSTLLMYSAYRYGMYFDSDLYGLGTVLCGTAILVLVLARMGRSSTSWVSDVMAKGRVFLLWPFVISAAYALHLLAAPLSIMGTLQQAMRWTFFGVFFLLVYAAASSKGGRSAAMLAMQLTGAFITFSSLAFWMGWAAFPEALFYSGNEQISALGARLAGFFQYPNMLAAVLAFYSLWYFILLSKAVQLSWRSIIPALLLVPTMLTLLLTESRGAWFAAGGAWLAGLLIVRGTQQKGWLLYSAISLPLSAFICRLLAGYYSGGQIAGSRTADSIIVLVLLAISGGLIMLFCFAVKSKRLLQRPLQLWLLLAAGLAGTVALLPSSLGGRLESGQYETAGARWLFYKDALRLFQEAPWLGQGGDTWKMLFERIQQQPYVGSKVHSGYLDILLDLGAVGLLLLFILLIIMVVKVWRQEAVDTLPAFILLVHAAVDFDNAFGFYWLLLFGYFALYLRESPVEGNVHSLVPLHRLKRSRQLNWPYMGLSAALILWLGAAGWSGWRLHLATAERESALSVKEGHQVLGLVRSLELNPYWTQTRLELAALLRAENRIPLLQEGLRHERESAELMWRLGDSYVELGDSGRAIAFMKQALERDRFNKERQTKTIVALTQLARRLENEGQSKESRLTAEAALQAYGAYEALVREVAAMHNPANGRRFEMTAEAVEYARACRELLAKSIGDPGYASG